MKGALKVTLWGREVGRLLWDKNRSNSYFTFNPEYLNDGLDISPLSASIHGLQGRMPVWGEQGKYQRLPPFLADSLPDDWGNQLFEIWRTEQKIPTAEITCLEKLSFIGKRGMGAFEFEPETRIVRSHEKVDVKSLVDMAGRIFSERVNLRIAPEESLTMQSLIAVGTSAGGRQPKAIIARNRTTGEIRSGQIAGLADHDYCILKFGDPQRSSAEIEMTYFEMARMAGIDMMDSCLLDVEGNKHFLTKRFDRAANGDKLHTQTLAALYPQADSYEKLLWVCRKMRLSEKDCEEVFRRMVFNVLANNTDDHDKNFSFIMDKTGKWRLSPAYDITFIFNYGGYQPQEERCLMLRGKTSGITKDDIMSFAKDNGIRHARSIVSSVLSAISSFRQLASKNGIGEEWTGRIETCLNSRLQDWGENEAQKPTSILIDGHAVENARIEQAYKGNYHLLATIDDKDRKYIFRPNTEEYACISMVGISNMTSESLYALVSKYLIQKK